MHMSVPKVILILHTNEPRKGQLVQMFALPKGPIIDLSTTSPTHSFVWLPDYPSGNPALTNIYTLLSFKVRRKNLPGEMITTPFFKMCDMDKRKHYSNFNLHTFNLKLDIFSETILRYFTPTLQQKKSGNWIKIISITVLLQQVVWMRSQKNIWLCETHTQVKNPFRYVYHTVSNKIELSEALYMTHIILCMS